MNRKTALILLGITFSGFSFYSFAQNAIPDSNKATGTVHPPAPISLLPDSSNKTSDPGEAVSLQTIAKDTQAAQKAKAIDSSAIPSESNAPVPATAAIDSSRTLQNETAPIAEIPEEIISVKGGSSPEYRSPRKAGLFSLLVPGLGQYYVRSYKKAAGFLAVEAGCFGIMSYFNQKGKDQYNDFLNYHEDHFDSTQYNEWYSWAQTNFGNNTTGLDSNHTLHHSYYEEAAMDRNQQYFEITAGYSEFSQGWDDVTPTLNEMQSQSIPDSILGHPAVIEGAYLIRLEGTEDTLVGYSKNQNTANQKRLDSNREYRKAEWVWYAILVNHLCSAVDAALSANRYNRTLLGLAPSFLDRLHVQSRTYPGGNGAGVPIVTLSLTF